MAIQHRRGNYADFDPTKMVAGEPAVVLGGDPTSSDGKAAYIAFGPGSVKKLATAEDMRDEIYNQTQSIIQEVEEGVADDVERAEAAAESVTESAAQIAQNTQDINDIKADLSGITPLDTTLKISGKAADAKKVGDGLAENKSKIAEVQNEVIRTAGTIEELECGLTEEVKTALLACFEQVAWIGADGKTYYDALETALNKKRTISSINAVFTQGSAVVYDTDELYSLKQYLTVTVAYNDTTTKEVSNYTLDGTLTAGTSTITVAYGKKTTTFNVTVTHQQKTLESINATLSSSAAMTTDNVLDDLRPYLTVRATYSDGSTQTVSNYTLNGSMNVGANTITVTYGGKTTTFIVNVTQAEKTLQRITAVFNQGSAVIYTDSSLNDLKSYLTVTARYTDGTTQTVTNYTLSGTLTEGTSTITATYGGKVDTFDVIVTRQLPSPIYSLASATEFNGTSDYVDTGIKLMDEEKIVTVVYDALSKTSLDFSSGENPTIFHCMNENSPYPGINEQFINYGGYNVSLTVNGDSKVGILAQPINSSNERIRFVIVLDTENGIAKAWRKIGDNIASSGTMSLSNFVAVSQNLIIGAYQTTSGTKGRFWKGTMYDFKVYDFAFTDNEATAYLQEDHS